ncbi:hypothetical protein MKW92_037893 [Papaver armeniacum]|nr:hypothetical protein MKW92_037893 [Papaver armeniacum]
MHHSSIDPSVTAATGSQNVIRQGQVLFMCLFELSGNKGGDLSFIVCGGVVAAGGGELAEAACGGRCLYAKAYFKRGYAEEYWDGVHNPKAHMDTENEEEVEDD